MINTVKGNMFFDTKDGTNSSLELNNSVNIFLHNPENILKENLSYQSVGDGIIISLHKYE